MSVSAILWYYLWIAPHVLLAVVLYAMFRRGFHRQFPIFFLYNCYEILQFAILFTLSYSALNLPKPYQYVYAVGLAGSTALRFGVIGEIVTHLVRNYAALNQLKIAWIRWITLGLLFVSLLLAVYTQGYRADSMAFAVHILDRTASIMQCGLLLCLLLTGSYLDLLWRNHVFGLVLGMGFFSGVELIAATVRTQMGAPNVLILDFLTMGAYHICVLIWIVYFLVPERVPQNALKSVPEGADLEEWNQELQRLIGR